MTRILKLQRLYPEAQAFNLDAVFVSGISSICPVTTPGAQGVFEME